MPRHARHRVATQDVVAGALFAAIGLAGLWIGRKLNVGTAADMGEGYFPLAMCWVLVGLGALIVMKGLMRPVEALEPFAWRGLLLVSAAVLGFALVLEPLGVIAAIVLAVLLANSAGIPMRSRGVIVLAAVLSVAVLAIFVWGLGLPLRALPRAAPW